MKAETLHSESKKLIETLRAGGTWVIDELMNASKTTISKATVLRRLDELVRCEWVERIGKARATRYYLTPKGRIESIPENLRSPIPVFTSPPMSFHGLRETEPGEGEDEYELNQLRAAIRRPLDERFPVGYSRDFLSDYRPNQTFYLPEELRDELKQAGQSPQMANMPAGTYVRNVFQRVLIDLSWNSSRLEGNTYSLLENGAFAGNGA